MDLYLDFMTMFSKMMAILNFEQQGIFFNLKNKSALTPAYVDLMNPSNVRNKPFNFCDAV